MMKMWLIFYVCRLLRVDVQIFNPKNIHFPLKRENFGSMGHNALYVYQMPTEGPLTPNKSFQHPKQLSKPKIFRPLNPFCKYLLKRWRKKKKKKYAKYWSQMCWILVGVYINSLLTTWLYYVSLTVLLNVVCLFCVFMSEVSR